MTDPVHDLFTGEMSALGFKLALQPNCTSKNAYLVLRQPSGAKGSTKNLIKECDGLHGL